MTKPREPILSWAEIDLKALRHNFRILKKMGGELLPVIKADAYGHGMLDVASELDKLGVKIFGVSDLIEGMELRRSGFKNDILLLENVLPEFAADIVSCNLIPSVCTLELAKALNQHARARGKKLNIHIKIDTGMGRLGVWHEEAAQFIHQVARFSNLVIDGIFTHFPLADKNRSFTEKQIKIFARLLDTLGPVSRSVRYLHAANSMGLSSYKTKIFNLSRPGLMLYGLYPTDEVKRKIKLKPVMSVKTRVIYLKKLAKGRGISYGHTFVAKKNIPVATLAIGYSDGYFRALSNRSAVFINGRRCPVVGNVTMDQIMVDTQSVKKIKPGDEAVVLGKNISAEELGKLANTINYEVVCSFGNRLPRIYF